MTPLAERLALDNLDMVKKVVSHVLKGSRPPACVDREDLEGYASIGLVKAANSYDPSRNDNFQAYAFMVMRGAVVDYIRQTIMLVNFTSIEEARQIAACEPPTSDVIAIARMRRSFGLLNDRERLIVELFSTGMTQRDAGHALGISESRVSQIMAKALGKLRAGMEMAA